MQYSDGFSASPFLPLSTTYRKKLNATTDSHTVRARVYLCRGQHQETSPKLKESPALQRRLYTSDSSAKPNENFVRKSELMPTEC